MNILYFVEYFPESEEAELTGGVETRTYFLAKELAKKHNITIITTTQNKPRIQNFNNIQLIRCKSLPYTRTGHKSERLKIAKKMYETGKRFLRKNKIDIIDAHNFFTYYPATKLAKEYKIKHFVNYHEVWLNNWIKNTGTKAGIIGEFAERFILHNLKRNNAKFIAVSQYTKNKLIKAGIDPNKVSVVHNGVDLNKYKKNIKKFKTPTICTLNRLTPSKRTQDVIKAIKFIKKDIPEIKCKLIGDGPEKTKLKTLTKQLKLKNNIEFLGFVERYEDVIKTVKQSKIFCLPSVLEGFGIATVEAMACNTPFVSSSIAPTREITLNGMGGLLYKPGNYRELAQKAITLLKDKKLYKKKQKEAQKLIKRYDWKNLAKQLESEYLSN